MTLIFETLLDGWPDVFAQDGNGEVWNMWKNTIDPGSSWSGWAAMSTP